MRDPANAEFALLLTHDIDRPYKTYQSLYYALTGGGNATRAHHLSTLRPDSNPYWQFPAIRSLESSLGVRSAFYALSEQRLFRDRPPREWLSKDGWMRYAGRYRLSDPRIRQLLRELDAGGWEVGLHGSFESYRRPELLQQEKEAVEDVLDAPVTGCRQHHLNLDPPDTWRYQRALGLQYDASLGSSDTYGFQHGYGVKRPFDDEFVVFPLTIMEQALPDPGTDFERAWAACLDVLDEAADAGAVMSVLWHPRTFSEREFPGHARLYERLVKAALDCGAWVGAPATFYEEAGLSDPTVDW